MLVAAWRMLRGGVTQRAEPRSRDASPSSPAASAVGVLSGLVGVGGGFLIVPALVLLAGVPMASAVGTSLAVITLNSFTGFAKYLGVLAAQSLELDWRVLLAVAGRRHRRQLCRSPPRPAPAAGDAAPHVRRVPGGRWGCSSPWTRAHGCCTAPDVRVGAAGPS